MLLYSGFQLGQCNKPFSVRLLTPCGTHTSIHHFDSSLLDSLHGIVRARRGLLHVTAGGHCAYHGTVRHVADWLSERACVQMCDCELLQLHMCDCLQLWQSHGVTV